LHQLPGLEFPDKLMLFTCEWKGMGRWRQQLCGCHNQDWRKLQNTSERWHSAPVWTGPHLRPDIRQQQTTSQCQTKRKNCNKKSTIELKLQLSQQHTNS